MKSYEDLTVAQKELYLYATNTGRLYSLRCCVERCLVKRKRKGVFEAQKAPAAFRGFVDAAAKSYHETFCCDDTYRVFTPADRRAVCEALYTSFEDEFSCGNWSE